MRFFIKIHHKYACRLYIGHQPREQLVNAETYHLGYTISSTILRLFPLRCPSGLASMLDRKILSILCDERAV